MTITLTYEIKQMSKDQKDPRRVREFQWYEVETKVREIMSQLLQPFNKKQTEDTIKINEMKRVQATVLKKLQDHDFLLQRQNAQKPTYVQIQDQKIADIQKKLQETHIDTHSSIKKMEGVIAIYEEKITQLNELERRVDKEVIERVNQFTRFKDSIQKEVSLMIKRQDQQIEESNQFKNVTKGAVNKMQTRMISFDNRLKQLQDDYKHRVSDINKLMEDVTNHNERMIKLSNKVDNLSERVQDREKDTKLSEKFLAKVREIEGDIRYQNTFLEQYQPLYIQMMIADTLDSCLQGRSRRRLCLYEEKKFAQLHHHILMNEKLTIADMMSTYSNQIRKIINRNKKFVIHLAVKETIKHGGNIYQFRIEDIASIQDDEQRNRKVQTAVDPSQILAVVNQRLEGLPQTVKKIVDEQLKSTRTWMGQLQEQTLLRSMEYDQKYEESKKKIVQIVSKEELNEKYIQKEIARLGQQEEQLQWNLNQFKEYVKDILNFSSVINHIVIQDQIDRQGTALYALRHNKNQPVNMPTFQLDPTCINCQTKSNTIIQQAFKMACLTYNPSQIKIDEQLFSREQILQISTGILQKLKKKLWTSDYSRPQEEVFLRRERVAKEEGKRKSYSTLKESVAGRQSNREKDYQTLLPNLGSTSRPSRKTHLSVFY